MLNQNKISTGSLKNPASLVIKIISTKLFIKIFMELHGY